MRIFVLGLAIVAASYLSIPAASYAAPLPQPLSESSGALSVALNKSLPLTLPQEARDIIVGNPEIADVLVRSPGTIYLIGKKVGDTNLFFLDQNGKTVLRVEAHVHLDMQPLKSLLVELLPDERIEPKAVHDSIVLSGRVASNQAAANAMTLARRFVGEDSRLINMMQVKGEQQVLLQVRVAEVQKTVLKELGVKSSLTGVEVFDEGTLNFATSGLGLTSTPFATAGLANIGNLALTFNLLERNGLVKTLAEPNLTAVSGEVAQLLAGGEFPVPKSDKDGQVSFDFKPFGVALSFTPVVLDGGRISLKMATEVSSLSNSIQVQTANTVIPALTVRRTSTTVEMPSGGNLMIAGLLQNDIVSSLNGLPGLMDLPILGGLFRSNAFQRNETELVITLSAIVVQPTDGKALALPTDGFAPGSDLDLYLWGKLYKTYVAPSTEIPDPPQGPLGYIVP